MSGDASPVHLFSPLQIRSLTIPNRIAVSPMCMYSAGTDGRATPWHLVHLGARAVGGAGIVFTEATSVTADGRITDGDLGLWSDEHESGLASIAAFIREQGSVPAIQLSHAGRKGGRSLPWAGYQPLEDWGPLFAPSPLPFRDGWIVPEELSVSQIKRLVEDFADAAERAVRCGFELIELHFAHGYLVHQFLTPLVNRRDDEYGGDLAHRARFAVEIAAAVRKRVGEAVPVAARLSVVDWAPDGLTLDDSVEISKMLQEVGVDLIDCSSGAAVDGEKVTPEPHYQVPYAERIGRLDDMLTAAVGLITEPAEADRVIRERLADLILIGRASLREADWPRRAARELQSDAAPLLPIPYRRAVERMARKTQW